MATYEYFYTLSANTDYSEYFDTAEQGTLATEDWLKFDDLADELHNERNPNSTNLVKGIYIGPETEKAPYATTLKVKKKMRVVYYARFYMKKIDNGTSTYYWLTDDAVKNVTITPAGNKYTKIAGVTTLKPGAKGWKKSTYPTVLGVTSGHCFVFTMYVKQDNFTLDSPFTVTAKVTPSNYQYSGGTPDPSSTVVNVSNGDIAGLNPKIRCTQADVTPTPNSNFLTALQDTSQGSGYYTYPAGSANSGTPNDVASVQSVYAYDACTTDPKKKWIGVKWGRTISADRKQILVKYTVFYGSADGQSTTQYGGTDPVTKGKNYITSPKLEKLIDQVIAARISNCASSSDGGNNNNNNQGNADTLLVRPVPPLDAARWNPPPHVDARGVSYAKRIDTGIFFSGNGKKIDPSEFQNIVNTYIGTRPERGRIFQDKVTAKIMNTTKVSVQTKKADTLQWGFRFMYNPEIIEYQSADNSGIDWTYGSKDSSVVLGGSQTLSFDLLINRIPDMSYLSSITNSKTRYDNLAVQSVYGRNLEQYEIDGILKRGTEYDIEYLYRVLVGDPSTNSLLLEESYAKDALTSDIGYITKVPIWLYLHDNMRLFGSIASMSVTHRIFNQDMVPMLTKLSIGFTRYPAYAGTNPNEIITKTTAASTGN